jgi:hypothetical protein
VNAVPSLALWLQALLVLAVGGAVVVSLAALAARWSRSGAGRRTCWQTAVLGLATLFLAEITGLHGVLPDWVHPRGSGTAKTPPLPDTAEAEGTESELELPPSREPEVIALPACPVPPSAGPPPAATPEGTAVWWPGIVWLVGSIAVLTRVGAARLLLVVFRWRHPPVVGVALDKRIRCVADRLGLRRRVLVLEAEGLHGPVAFGWLRPTIALPTRFETTFTPTQQEAILAHELAHLAARDPAWHLFADLVAALLWWHPLAWWARHQLRTASELAADEASLVVPDGPGMLAACLVDLGARLAGVRLGWLRMAGNGFRSSLGRRVDRLLRLDGQTWQRPSRARHGLALILGLAVLCVAAVFCTTWARAQAFSEGDATMLHPWRRSLAAVVLVTALGSSGDTVRSGPPDEPGSPPGSGARSAPPARSDRAKEEEERVQDLKKLQDKILSDLDSLLERHAALKDARVEKARIALEKGGASEQKDLEKIEAQLEDLKQKVEALKQQKADVEAKLAALEEDKKATRIKVFRLKHRDPQEMQDILGQLLTRWEQPGAGPGTPGPGMPGMPGGPGMAGRMGGGGPPGFGGGGGPRGGGMGMVMAGMGPGPGMPGGGLGAPPQTFRLAVDERTRCLIVRGSTQDLQTATSLVAMLDQPDDKPLPRVENFRAFKLKHADANEVTAILHALDVKALIAPAPKARVLIVSGPESSMKEIAEIIEAVDVEGASTRKDEKDSFRKP